VDVSPITLAYLGRCSGLPGNGPLRHSFPTDDADLFWKPCRILARPRPRHLFKRKTRRPGEIAWEISGNAENGFLSMSAAIAGEFRGNFERGAKPAWLVLLCSLTRFEYENRTAERSSAVRRYSSRDALLTLFANITQLALMRIGTLSVSLIYFLDSLHEWRTKEAKARCQLRQIVVAAWARL